MGSTQNYREMTRGELYGLAQERDIEGRSQLSKTELAEALELDDVGPDAVDVLLEQHEDIRRLFSSFGELAPRPSKRKHKLVGGIIDNLMKHAQIEELVFYPAVRNELDGFEAEVDEDLEEHHAAELLLSELAEITPDAPRYDAKVTVLIETVTHHLEDEEQELLPHVREQMSAMRRRELGATMMAAWRAASPRPQWHVSAGPPVDQADQSELEAPESDRDTTDVEAEAAASGDTDDAMTRSEEELVVGTTTREAGTAHLRKKVTSEHVTESVPVKREEAVVQREPITDDNREDALEDLPLAEAEEEIILYAEEPVVEKRTVPKERVRLAKDTRIEHEVVGGDVAREVVEVEEESG